MIGVVAASAAMIGETDSQSVLVKGPYDAKATVTEAEMRGMQRATVTTPYGAKATYSGPLIGELLAEVGAPSDKRLHGAPVNQIIIITGEDGFTTVLSLAATENQFEEDYLLVTLAPQPAPPVTIFPAT